MPKWRWVAQGLLHDALMRAVERHDAAAIHDLLAAGAGAETKDRVLGMHAWLLEAHEGDVAQEFRRLLPC